ncbi:MAG: hydantoinase/oxoprolinase family protein, partial [Alphaproteobacteria bacterium]|nr:hydantoinase/oxoprolinase family protein [Alphaproteobacteria bacterium]
MHIGVDVGGTFTDIVVNRDDGSALLLHKLPSTPDAPERAIVEGLATLMQQHALSASSVDWLAHGTTVGTNALIQRKHGKVALITSRGFRDLMEIGRQTRPTVYDMHRDHPPPLVERRLRIDVPQRTLADGSTHVPLDEDAVRDAAVLLRRESVDCVVVCFLHSYAFPQDERRAAAILKDNLPRSVAVLCSSDVYPEFREYERFSTAVLNGALITVLGSYLDRLTRSVADLGIASEIKVTQSAGGLMSLRMAREYPVRASLSGPAAGVQGAQRRASAAGLRNIITLDVGGTRADVALLKDGNAVEVNERDLAGYPIRIPALDVNAVGAGGGSIAWIGRDGLLKVGPQSAGAVPGPLCYGLGGTNATVTDANVMLGRLDGESLLAGRMPIRAELAARGIAGIARELDATPDQAALGILRVAAATMVKAIRSISVERGHYPSDFSLFVYGGAGALFATEVARDLGMSQIVVPPDPGILCAEGALNAPLSTDFVVTVLSALDSDGVRKLRGAEAELKQRSAEWFSMEGVCPQLAQLVWTVGARYFGQNYELALKVDHAGDDGAHIARLGKAFPAA